MTRCLVTGGCGFIGSHLVDALVARGDEVRVLDDLSTGHLANLDRVKGKVALTKGSILDAEAVREAMQGVELVFHQAALASVPRSVANPLETHQVCVTGTINVLDQARRLGVRRVIYAASSSAYGNSPWAAKREADPTSPLSPYAAAKLAGEQYCQAFHHSYDLETVCLRYFNVFGPRQDPSGPYAAVVPAFILKMQSGERPLIFGDGKQSRDFTYIDNVVAGNLAAAKAAGIAGKVFNLASGRSYSLLDLVAALNQILGLKVEPVFDAARVGDAKDSLADIALATNELGYAPTVDFMEGLRKTVPYYRTPIST